MRNESFWKSVGIATSPPFMQFKETPLRSMIQEHLKGQGDTPLVVIAVTSRTIATLEYIFFILQYQYNITTLTNRSNIFKVGEIMENSYIKVYCILYRSSSGHDVQQRKCKCQTAY